MSGAAEAISTQQYEMAFASTSGLGTVADMVLQVGDQSATASIVVGSAVSGTDALNPTIIPTSGGVTFLQGNLGLILLIIVVLLAVGLLAYGVFMLFVREDRLASVLSPYESSVPVPSDSDDDGDTALARTAIMQRAVAITEQVATDRGVLVRAENALERANLPLRAGEALLFYVLIVALVTIVALALSGSLLLGLIGGVLAALIPIGVVNYLASRRRKQFMALLPDTLTLLASTPAGRLLADAGCRGGLRGGRRADGPRAAPRGHRGPARTTVGGGARRHRRAHGQPRLRLGRHGHPHPAGGRRQPLRAAHDRGRHDGPA